MRHSAALESQHRHCTHPCPPSATRARPLELVRPWGVAWRLKVIRRLLCRWPPGVAQNTTPSPVVDFRSCCALSSCTREALQAGTHKVQRRTAEAGRWFVAPPCGGGTSARRKAQFAPGGFPWFLVLKVKFGFNSSLLSDKKLPGTGISDYFRRIFQKLNVSCYTRRYEQQQQILCPSSGSETAFYEFKNCHGQSTTSSLFRINRGSYCSVPHPTLFWA